MACEYYERIDKTEKLFVLTHQMTGEVERFWRSEIDDEALDDKQLAGWQVSEQRRKRPRVVKYVLSGAKVLEGQTMVAGCGIPIVPVYGQRADRKSTRLNSSHYCAARMHSSA